MTEKNYTREDIDKACMQAANRFNQFEFQVPDAPGEEKRTQDGIQPICSKEHAGWGNLSFGFVYP